MGKQTHGPPWAANSLAAPVCQIQIRNILKDVGRDRVRFLLNLPLSEPCRRFFLIVQFKIVGGAYVYRTINSTIKECNQIH